MEKNKRTPPAVNKAILTLWMKYGSGKVGKNDPDRRFLATENRFSIFLWNKYFIMEPSSDGSFNYLRFTEAGAKYAQQLLKRKARAKKGDEQ